MEIFGKNTEIFISFNLYYYHYKFYGHDRRYQTWIWWIKIQLLNTNTIADTYVYPASENRIVYIYTQSIYIHIYTLRAPM